MFRARRIEVYAHSPVISSIVSRDDGKVNFDRIRAGRYNSAKRYRHRISRRAKRSVVMCNQEPRGNVGTEALRVTDVGLSTQEPEIHLSP